MSVEFDCLGFARILDPYSHVLDRHTEKNSHLFQKSGHQKSCRPCQPQPFLVV